MESYRKNNTILKKGIKYLAGFFGIIAILVVVSFADTNSNIVPGNTVPNSISGITIPDKLEFAGENVPVDYFDVKESLERELLVNSYWHSQTLLLIKRAKRYFGLIDPILKENNIPADFKYLALAESGFANVTSPSGAVGFWQFIPATAKEYGLEINNEIDERYHLEKSTQAACMFLKESYAVYGNWTMTAASYNCGRTGLNKQIQRQYATNYYDLLLNDETARYIFRILALKLVIGTPEKYGFNLTDEDLYQPIPFKEIKISEPIKDLALFAFDHGTNYKILKILNPWLRENYISNKEGKTYALKIPANGFRPHEKMLSSIEADSIGLLVDSTIK
jgi:membrane-bound lytic murein transglycosylase D